MTASSSPPNWFLSIFGQRNRLLVAACLASSLTACDEQPTSGPRSILTENGYSVIGIPTTAYPSSPTKPAWVDDDSVIFAGWTRGPYRNVKEAKQDPTNRNVPQLWTVSNGAAPYEIFDRAAGPVCSVNGFVAIWESRDVVDGRNHVRGLQGPIGAERPYEVYPLEEGVGWEHEICRYRQQHPLEKDFHLDHLLPGHGYLNFGPRPGSQNPRPPMPKATLIREDGTEVPLPVGWKTPFDRYCGSYTMYRQAYFYYRCYLGLDETPANQDPPEVCRDYFWLWPDGRTETGCVPFGPWATFVIDVLPTREGIVVANGQGTHSGSGLFLIKDGRGEKILTGWVQTGRARSVSPDGCRIAALYSHGVRTTIVGGKFFTVVVADVCKGT